MTDDLDDDPVDRVVERIAAWRRDAAEYHGPPVDLTRAARREDARLDNLERLRVERRLLLGVACLVLCVVLTTTFPILLYPALIAGVTATAIGIFGVVAHYR